MITSHRRHGRLSPYSEHNAASPTETPYSHIPYADLHPVAKKLRDMGFRTVDELHDRRGVLGMSLTNDELDVVDQWIARWRERKV